jgi:phage-related minor tail protein
MKRKSLAAVKLAKSEKKKENIRRKLGGKFEIEKKKMRKKEENVRLAYEMLLWPAESIHIRNQPKMAAYNHD